MEKTEKEKRTVRAFALQVNKRFEPFIRLENLLKVS